MAKQWRGPEYPGEFPTLGYLVIDFIEAKCVIPDGERMGDPFLLTEEMQLNLLHVYRLDPVTGRFVYDRGDQLCRSQKWGKGPFSAARICAECHHEGPVLFGGWDADGEPIGRSWATPNSEIAAVSEKQAGNIYKALLGMVREGPLLEDWPDTGDTRINLPYGETSAITPVTASPRSALGARVTFPVQDETHDMTERNGGRGLADTQRRNVAGMGGRFHSTTNAWDSTQESVAQVTVGESGVYIDDVDPPEGLSIFNKRDCRKALKVVYGDSLVERGGWVDPDRIYSEIVALRGRDAAQAERFYFNRKRASEGAAFNGDWWDELANPTYRPPKGAVVTAGVDGAQSGDALAIVATEVATGFQWPVGIWEAPKDAPSTYLHPDHEIDGAMTDFMEGEYHVWRVYVDPQYIKHLLVRWQNRWGEKRVVPWEMNRPKPVAWAVRNFTESIATAYAALHPKKGEEPPKARRSHDGNSVLTRHIKNARKQMVTTRDDKGRLMHTISKDHPDSSDKMDGAAAAVISDEAANDCIAAREDQPPDRVPVVF